MPNARLRPSIALSGLLALVAVGLVPVAPSWAEPDLDDVSARVDRLYHQAEGAQERYNDAKLELGDLQRDLDGLEADQSRQSKRLAKAQAQVQDSVVRQYQGEGLSAVGQVVVSEDPSAFVSQMSTMSAFNDMQDQLFDDYATELKALDIRTRSTKKRTDEVAKTEQQMADESKDVDAKLAEAKDLLAKLKADEREALVSRSSTTRDAVQVPSDVPASGRAAVAVRTALAQVGDAYVYGAAGPSAFDCSGLTMFAWSAAGVGLPHSSSVQSGSGARVAASDLRAGDLVFYYSPISHVGMYIGNGQIVHAANPGSGVTVAALYSMPYSGAVRPG